MSSVPESKEPSNAKEIVDSPLHTAMDNGDKRGVEFMLRRGDDPNAVNRWGDTPLHVVCRRDGDDDDSAKMLFELSRDVYRPIKIDAQNDNEDTPLHLALRFDNSRLAELLLRKGASPNAVNQWGQTPLHVICSRQYTADDLAELFFRTSEEMGRPVQVNAQTMLGDSPLHLALDKGHKRLAESLLRRGADPSAVNANGETALHVVARSWHAGADEFAKKLFLEIRQDRVRRQMIDQRDTQGNTPLHLALIHGNVRTAELLLRHGANPNLTNWISGSAALHMICRQDGPEDDSLLRLLSEFSQERYRPLRIDVQDVYGDTPLSRAMRYDNRQLVDFLQRKWGNREYGRERNGMWPTQN
ncbi:ankyrin-1-like [Trichogramma pretiosum]|uniref:ankyrin-1-like n=1 Tax=Trichogramma pretiosum TaxID=7493 RepID=UPI0006C9C7C8|nr:ankyrin-1-like [Trichogramma pretiosum]